MRLFNSNVLGSLIVLAVALFAMPAKADITWNVTFGDIGTGLGFDAGGGVGAARQATFMSVLSYINTVVDETGIGDITVETSQFDGSGFLAAAGPFFSLSPGFSSGSLFTHATTGVDPFGGTPDATATFDFGYTWNDGLGAPAGGEFDLFSVALHEMTHAMGFLSLVESTGVSAIGPGTNPGRFSTFDSFLEKGDGTALFSTAGGATYLGTAADLISDDVFFVGPNAGSVKVHAPGTFAPGSSISHITPSDAVMQFSIGPAVSRRAYTAADIGILQDIGWTLQAIPEPNSAILVVALFGLAAARRRKR